MRQGLEDRHESEVGGQRTKANAQRPTSNTQCGGSADARVEAKTSKLSTLNYLKSQLSDVRCLRLAFLRNHAQLNASVSDRVEGRMKRIRMFGVTLGMVLGFAAPTFSAQPSEAELIKQAKITKAEAEQIALAKVSSGIVKSAEIEKEKGHLVWSFDIARPGTRDITEILVDAKTGKIISIQTESPRDQAKEAAADKKQNQN
jgi:hypothetical protein